MKPCRAVRRAFPQLSTALPDVLEVLPPGASNGDRVWRVREGAFGSKEPAAVLALGDPKVT